MARLHKYFKIILPDTNWKPLDSIPFKKAVCRSYITDEDREMGWCIFEFRDPISYQKAQEYSQLLKVSSEVEFEWATPHATHKVEK